MKAITNFLILFVLVAIFAVVAYFLLDDSLFGNDTEHPDGTNTPSLVNGTTPSQEPQQVSTEEAFQSTNSQETHVTETKFDCTMAAKIMGNLYDQYHQGATLDQLLDSVQENTAIPEDQVESFERFSQNLAKTPAKQLHPKKEMLDQFMQQCQSTH